MRKKLKYKKIFEYPVIFEPAIEGGYNVSFPSFPGCVTFGDTFEEAKKYAREVLELWLEEMVSQGKKIPIFNSRPIIDDVSAAIPSKAKISYAANNC
ncbi:MAG: type II toxin-antitoxin system HicB family antitoxin [Candidatus Pacebacteria bacterium]|nr:type II toxin-antitoxin system HicB family antitoxin [Candidatus Paceibacterota bacterium]